MKTRLFKLRPIGPLDGGRAVLVAALFVIATALLGGGSRPDIASLPLLRPLAAALLAYLIMRGHASSAEARMPLLALAAVATAILVQLVPLPPAIWQSMPGRELVIEIDRAAGLSGVWRPIALDPQMAFNSLFSLTVPAVAVILAAKISDPEQTRRLVWVVFGTILVGALLGVFQLMSGGSKALYLYRISNFDSSVGLFANRNHHALALASALPLASYLASTVKATRVKGAQLEMFLLAIVVILVPLIVLTGSRQGLLFAALGMAAATALYRRPDYVKRRVESRWTKINFRLVAMVLVPVMIAVSLLAGRVTVFDRLSGSIGEGQVDRLVLLPLLTELAKTYFPFGAGAGSFVRVFKVIEPPELLQPSYYNHAHNDFLEAVIDFGAFGLLAWMIVLVCFAVACRRLFREWRSGRLSDLGRLGLAGAAVLAMCLMASAVDYPLRVPSIQVLAALSAVWLIRASKANVALRNGPRTAGQA